MYSSVCTASEIIIGQPTNIKKYEFQTQCMANNYLNGLTIGGRFGKDNDQILWQCGCCDDRNLIDNLTDAGTSTAKADITFKEEPYCHAPVCTPNGRRA